MVKAFQQLITWEPVHQGQDQLLQESGNTTTLEKSPQRAKQPEFVMESQALWTPKCLVCVIHSRATWNVRLLSLGRTPAAKCSSHAGSEDSCRHKAREPTFRIQPHCELAVWDKCVIPTFMELENHLWMKIAKRYKNIMGKIFCSYKQPAHKTIPRKHSLKATIPVGLQVWFLPAILIFSHYCLPLLCE